MSTYQAVMSAVGHWFGILTIITVILSVGEKWLTNQVVRHPAQKFWTEVRSVFEDLNDLAQILSLNLREMIKGVPPDAGGVNNRRKSDDSAGGV